MVTPPRLKPSKDEMCRVIQEWVQERCGIKHARIDNLHRLNITDVEVIYLAIGYKLDLRDVAWLEKQFQYEWERRGKHRTVDAVADQKEIGHE